jgi:Ca2+/Na+ antiporter
MLADMSPPDVVFLFAAAGFVLYIASRAAVDALTSATDPSPARMAAAQCMPIAWTALLATAAGRSDVGIGIVFATSIAALALDLGVLTMMSPPGAASAPDGPPPSARAWPFLIPAALLPLLAGFSAALAWWHALMMLLLAEALEW